MNKLYDRIDWHNNTTPAINETNLNRMSKAVDDIDDRVVDIAATVMETVPQIQEDLEEAQELLEDAQEISTHPPIIGQNGNWWTWDTATDAYVDSGVDAGVSLTIGSTATLPAGSDATVTNTGTATDPVLNFGIPRGLKGDDGVSPEVTITDITGGHTVKITDADHPSGQSFNVMDGEDGEGVPTGGTTGQVLAKASGTDYDTEWVNASGGSGGHTILNDSGTAMNARANLQFIGADVTDDPSNDKTIVTGTPQSMIGDAWVNNHNYAAGDYCIDGNVLYKCKTAHTSSASYRPPYASYWDAVSVAGELIEYGGVVQPYTSHTALTTITANSDANYIVNNIGTASLADYKAYILSGVTNSNMFFIIGGDELEASLYIHQHMLASGTTKAYIYSPVSWTFIYGSSVGLELYTGNSYFAGKTGTLYGIK